MAATLETIRTLPWAAHALVALALLAGLILWAAGRRVLRPATIALFAAIGGAIGLFALPFTAVGDSVGMLGGMVMGTAAGAISGMLLYRFTLAVGCGAVLAVAAPVTATILLAAADPAGSVAPQSLADQYQRNAERYADLHARIGEDLNVPDEGASPAADGDGRASGEGSTWRGFGVPFPRMSQESRDRVRAFIDAARDDARTAWNDLPDRERFVIIIGGAGGLMIGFLMGLALPRWAAGAATALVGSAVWLGAGVWLARALGAPGGESLAQVSGRGWLLAWAVVSVVGFGVQVWGSRQATAAPAED